MDMKTIMGSFSLPWRRLLGQMYGMQRPLDTHWMTSWQQKTELCGQQLDWTGLLKSLAREEPAVQDGKLVFKPVLQHFPVFLQKHVLAFIHHHKSRIALGVLRDFVTALDCHHYQDEWIQLTVHLLRSHIKVADKQDRGIYQFSEENTGQLSNLLNKIKTNSTGSSSCWRKSPWRRKMNIGPTLTDSTQGRISQKKRNLEEIQSPSNSSTALSQPAKKPRLDPVADTVEDSVMEDGDQVIILDSSASIDNSQHSVVNSSQLTSEPGGTSSELPDELKVAISGVYESWHGSEVDVNPAALHTLLATAAPQHVEDVYQCLKLESVPEANLQKVFTTIIKAEISFTCCKQLVQHLVLPRVNSLEQNASRILLAGVSSLARDLSKQVIQGVLVPAMHAEQFGMPQADLICRLTKDILQQPTRVVLLQGILEQPCKWTESHVMVFQAIIDSKVELSDASILTSLVSHLEENCQQLAGSLRFAKLTLAIINKYTKQLSQRNAVSLGQVVDNNSTFLKKSLQSALKKLTK